MCNKDISTGFIMLHNISLVIYYDSCSSFLFVREPGGYIVHIISVVFLQALYCGGYLGLSLLYCNISNLSTFSTGP